MYLKNESSTQHSKAILLWHRTKFCLCLPAGLSQLLAGGLKDHQICLFSFCSFPSSGSSTAPCDCSNANTWWIVSSLPSQNFRGFSPKVILSGPLLSFVFSFPLKTSPYSSHPTPHPPASLTIVLKPLWHFWHWPPDDALLLTTKLVKWFFWPEVK